MMSTHFKANLAIPNEMKRRLSQLLSFIQGPAFILSNKGYLIDANQDCRNLIFEQNSLESIDLSKQIDPSNWEKIQNITGNVENSNILEIDNARITSPSGLIYFTSIRCMIDGDFVIVQAKIKSDERIAFFSDFEDNGITDLMLEAIPAPVFCKDINHVYTACNEEFLKFNGYKRKEIIGKNVFDIAPKNVADVYRKADNALFASGGRQVYETQTENAYGEKRDVIFHKSVINDSMGNPLGLIGIILDITSRKQAERELQENKNLFNAIVTNSPAHIFVKDLRGIYVVASEKLNQVFGWPEKYMIGKSDFDLFSPEIATSFIESDNKVLKSGQSNSERSSIEIDDMLTTCLTVKFPLFDADGKQNGIAGIATDISELVAIENKLKEAAVDLEIQIKDRTKELSDEIKTRQHAESELRNMLSASPVAVGISDLKSGQLSFANDSLANLLRIPKEERLENSTLRFWKNMEDRKEIAAEFIKHGKTKPREIEIICADGETVWVLLSWTSLNIDDDTKIVSWLYDISQIKEAEKLLKDSHEVLEEHVALRTKELENEISERKKIELTLRKSEAQFEASANSTSDWFWGMDEHFKYDSLSERFEEITGQNPKNILGKTRWSYAKDSLSDETWRHHKQILEQHKPFRDFRFTVKKDDGTLLHASISGMPVFDEIGVFKGYRGAGRDISQELEAAEQTKLMEEQLHQAQKMEAIGQLTGGIAHDFNNILAVILGNIELVQEQLANDSTLTKYTAAVENSALRGAKLTQRLLAYSRKQELRPTPIQLNSLIGDILNLVERLIGEEIRIHYVWSKDAPSVIADSNQLENAFMNLCINARDAMPKGGDLLIETGLLIVSGENQTDYPELALGKYSFLSVKDTGCGMDAETLTHVFEPFFTTKEVGKGTGLGLSMVYGFAHQSNGTVELKSTPDEGTTATLILPSNTSRH